MRGCDAERELSVDLYQATDIFRAIPFLNMRELKGRKRGHGFNTDDTLEIGEHDGQAVV